MAKLHNANGKRDTNAMYRSMGDRNISTPRCGAGTARAIKMARIVADSAESYGHTCDRTLLLFIDDHSQPDYLAAIVMSLDNATTLVLHVDRNGSITSKNLHNVRTAKRLGRDFMYAIVGETYHGKMLLKDGRYVHASDPEHDRWHTRVYARNLSCYTA